MTEPSEPRDPRHRPPEPAASQGDLTASEQLEGWLAVSRHDGDNRETPRPTGRAGAMLDARDVLRSRDDAATSLELDCMLEDALAQLTDGPRPLRAEAVDETHAGGPRHRSVRAQWIATAAAVVLIMGVGALMLFSPEPEESAQDSAASAMITRPSQSMDDQMEMDPAEAPTSSAPGPSQQADAPNLDAESSPTTDGGDSTAPDDSEGSREANGDGTDAQAATHPGSTFAGVHASGQIPLP